MASRVSSKLSPPRKGTLLTPPWKKRLEVKVVNLRKDLGRLEELRHREPENRTRNELMGRYNIKEKGWNTVIEEVRQRLIATSAKVKRFTDRVKGYHQNSLFANNQSALYRELNGESKESDANSTPNAEESKRFWSGIWEHQEEHNREAPWLKRVEQELQRKAPKQNNWEITKEILMKAMGKIKNWKVAGPDAVHGCWIKNITALHVGIAYHLNECLQLGATPAWMTKGRTVLIQKDKSRGNIASNYRPITCLPLMWKLLTSMVAQNINSHLEEFDLIGHEQKGCRVKTLGAKDHLLLDKVILKDPKARKANLTMAWIDYQKAYDYVPHSWIQKSLQMIGIADNIKNLLTQTMKTWETALESEGKQLARVSIRRGIFQGDSLSPLLFVMALVPMTLVLRDAPRYVLKSKTKINHLLYMDDLKLYGKTKSDIESLISTVKFFSDDISMRFGLQKCASIVLKRGKRVEDEGIQLVDDKVIEDVGIENYKYLGVLEADIIKMELMKEKIMKEYR